MFSINIIEKEIKKNTIWEMELIWKDFNLTLLIYSSSIGSLENVAKYKPKRKLKKDRVSVTTFMLWFKIKLNKSSCVAIHIINPIGNRNKPIFLKRLGNRNSDFIVVFLILHKCKVNFTFLHNFCDSSYVLITIGLMKKHHCEVVKKNNSLKNQWVVN